MKYRGMKMKYNLDTIDEFIQELCEFNHEIINEYIQLTDLELFFEQTEWYWNGVNNELKKNILKKNMK